jgi:hypothetical protein
LAPHLAPIYPSAWKVKSAQFHRVAHLHCYAPKCAAYRLKFYRRLGF